MPPTARRRRTVPEDSEESNGESSRPTQGTQIHRRQAPVSPDENDDEDLEEEDQDEETDADVAESSLQDQVVKKLLRYALACEHQRIRITRAGITEKVIGKQRGTAFKRIFEKAQQELRHKFGMEMVPLPANDKVTMKQKRDAAKRGTSSKSSTSQSYILTSILPPEYKTAEILPPSMIGSQKEEAQYMAVCTLIVSLISLTPGGISDARLQTYLGRLNLDTNTPVGNLNDTLSRMRKEGYINRVVDPTPDEETITWHVGPRGKVEISSECVRGFVHEVYGDRAPEDLDKRLQRSLGLGSKKTARSEVDDEENNREEDER